MVPSDMKKDTYYFVEALGDWAYTVLSKGGDYVTTITKNGKPHQQTGYLTREDTLIFPITKEEAESGIVDKSMTNRKMKSMLLPVYE